MTFPDTIPASTSQWATMIPARNPEFKVHSKESLANSAMSQRGLRESFAKYELVGDKWILRWKYEPRDACDRCGVLYKNIQGTNWDRSRCRPDHATPAWSSIVVCCSCKRSLDLAGVGYD